MSRGRASAVDEALANQSDGCASLTADQIASGDSLLFSTPARSKFMAFGYPLNQFKIVRAGKITRTPGVAYVGGIVPPATYKKQKLNPRTHIVIEFDHKQVIGPAGNQRAPKLEGLSGGGMFRMPTLEGVNKHARERLAAITIEARRESRLIVGVRIELVLSAIDKDTQNQRSTQGASA